VVENKKRQEAKRNGIIKVKMGSGLRDNDEISTKHNSVSCLHGWRWGEGVGIMLDWKNSNGAVLKYFNKYL